MGGKINNYTAGGGDPEGIIAAGFSTSPLL
jgi:hypothetical protein